VVASGFAQCHTTPTGLNGARTRSGPWPSPLRWAA
jgi:hypothetical protein